MGPAHILLHILTNVTIQDVEAMAGTIPSAGCSARIDLHPFSIVEIDHVVGYTGGSQYFRTGMTVPEPVPIGLLFDDNDRVLFRCGLSCVEEAFDSGAFNAQWTLESPGGLYPGAFIESDGFLAPEHTGSYSRDFVLYLPPTEVATGYAQQVLVKALVYDKCAVDRAPSEADEPDCPGGRFEHIIEVNTVRLANGKYEVVAHPYPLDCDLEESGCAGITLPCCSPVQRTRIQSDPENPQLDLDPNVIIIQSPVSMCLGEIRPLLADGWDMDMWLVECGNEIQPPDCEQTDLPGERRFCDRVTFEWEVDNGLGQTGDGEFLYMGRSTLFRATAPGSITITVTILDHLRQEPWTDDVTFMIEPITVKEVTYGDIRPVALDRDNDDGSGGQAGNAYPQPHWRDTNADGDASDGASGNDPGDRRYPVAYNRNKNVKVQEIHLSSKASLPQYYFELKGTGPDGMSFEGGFAQYDASKGALVATNILSSTKLPSSVKRYVSPFYTIDWQLQMGDGLRDAGSSDTPVYVMNAGSFSPLLHTVCDLSCDIPEGLSGTSVFPAIYGRFGSLVARKAIAGNNASDGKELGYWVTNSEAFTYQQMLASADGSGRCEAWARFMVACIEAHGGVAQVVNIRPKAPAIGIAVQVWQQVGPGQSGNPDFPYILLEYPGQTDVFDLIDDLGISGQNNSNPQSVFSNHALVGMSNKLHDPSYGSPSPKTTLQSWENSSLHSVGTLVNGLKAMRHQHFDQPDMEIY